MRLQDAKWIETKNRGRAITPSALVIHYTAGGSTDGAVQTFLNAGVSAHFVIGRNGELIQMVDTDVAAWHAGVSIWNGRRELNQWSIGIELVNWGPLTRNDKGDFISWAKTVVPQSEVYEGQHKNKDCKYDYWHSYTLRQIAMLKKVVCILREHYGILGTDIVGHDDVSPGRKIDPGPAFLFWKCIRGMEKKNDDA